MPPLRLTLATILALAVLVAIPGRIQADVSPAEAIEDVAKDLPTLPPDLIWAVQLPGYRRPSEHRPSGPIATQLEAAIQGLSVGWPPTGYRTDWTGTPGLLTHLSPPGEPPRATFWLTDGHLYLVENSPTGWQTRRLTEPYATYTAVIDLSGDGQPEVVAATDMGSGGFLYLQILAWDKERVWTAFSHQGIAGEPGRFGWFDAEGDGRRELWIDTGSTKGLFTDEPYAHSPFLRDRLTFRWENGTYKETARYRFATPLYHLNRCLYLASKGDWQGVAKHAEPGAQIDRTLVAELGIGPFRGGSDHSFVNGRIYFTKGAKDYFADFGPTGRLIQLGASPPRMYVPSA